MQQASSKPATSSCRVATYDHDALISGKRSVYKDVVDVRYYSLVTTVAWVYGGRRATTSLFFCAADNIYDV